MTTTRRPAPAGEPFPIQVRLLHLGSHPELEQMARRRAAWLRRHVPRIVGCRVTVALPHRRRRKGGLFEVRIAIVLPGGTFTVAPTPAEPSHEDPMFAVHDAFDAALEELRHLARTTRHERARRAGAAA